MTYQKLSNRQLLSMLRWQQPKFKDKDALICDGSIRSGKTLTMTVGFVLWAMCSFHNQKFAICGKTIESLRRNVVINMRDWIPYELNIEENEPRTRSSSLTALEAAIRFSCSAGGMSLAICLFRA